MEILNEKLFRATIANLLLILIYGIHFPFVLFGLISIPFTFLSSTDRKYIKYAILTSFVSSVVEFPTFLYPASLLTSFIVILDLKDDSKSDTYYLIGTILIAIIDITILLIYLGSILLRIPLSYYLLFSVSATSAYLGFLSYRGYKGLDYREIFFEVSGLPQGVTWFLNFNGKTYDVSDNFTTIKEIEGDYIICPVKVGNDYFIPDNYYGIAKGGDRIKINFTKQHSVDLDKFKGCTVTFVIKGLPKNSEVSLEVDGTLLSRKVDSNEIMIQFLPSSNRITWKASEIIIGEVMCEPQQRYDTVNIDQKIISIEYECVKLDQQQNIYHLNVYSWDPKVWLNQQIYGYKITEIIGEGGNSYVIKGENGGKSYAIKILKISSPSRSQTIAITSFLDLFKESNNIIQLSNHENIVKLYGIFIDVNQISNIIKGNGETYLHNPPAIIMEYMEGGTAKDLMSLYAESYEWYQIVKIIIKEIALALSHIHSSGYVHLDVKPQNIFFAEKMSKDLRTILNKLSLNPKIIKLGDLGSATKIGGKIYQITPEYGSPKQLENGILGLGAEKEMDIFSLGMVAYTMLSNRISPIAKLLDDGLTLYLNNDLRGALVKVAEAKNVINSWSIDLPSNVPIELKQVVEGCIKGRIKDAPEIVKLLG